MDREEKNLRKSISLEPEVFLQWGNRKRLRCVRVKDPQTSQKSSGIIPRTIASRFLDRESSPISQTNRFTRNSEGATVRSGAIDGRRASSLSPEKEDRYYTTRGSAVAMVDEIGKVSVESNNGGEGKGVVWPKLYITLSSKEKEEDFMAMKGCKPPQRPKKRAKVIQRSLLLVSPGAWLTDMCQERYEVREKKSSKKRPRGLKAMGGSMDSDSEQ